MSVPNSSHRSLLVVFLGVVFLFSVQAQVGEYQEPPVGAVADRLFALLCVEWDNETDSLSISTFDKSFDTDQITSVADIAGPAIRVGITDDVARIVGIEVASVTVQRVNDTCCLLQIVTLEMREAFNLLRSASLRGKPLERTTTLLPLLTTVTPASAYISALQQETRFAMDCPVELLEGTRWSIRAWDASSVWTALARQRLREELAAVANTKMRSDAALSLIPVAVNEMLWSDVDLRTAVNTDERGALRVLLHVNVMAPTAGEASKRCNSVVGPAHLQKTSAAALDRALISDVPIDIVVRRIQSNEDRPGQPQPCGASCIVPTFLASSVGVVMILILFYAFTGETTPQEEWTLERHESMKWKILKLQERAAKASRITALPVKIGGTNASATPSRRSAAASSPPRTAPRPSVTPHRALPGTLYEPTQLPISVTM